MKNKKGFTLIELLAVIVILAIIALIATPIVLNMIKNARLSAAKSSSLGYIDSIEKYAEFSSAQAGGLNISGYDKKFPTTKTETVTCSLENNTWTDGENIEGCSTFMTAVNDKTKGNKATKMTLIMNKHGKVLDGTTLTMNGFNCTYDGKDVDCSENHSGDTTTPDTPSKPVNEIKEFKPGNEILYNPKTASKCDAVAGDCMRFYAIEDSDKTKSKVNAILDHNTTAIVAWNSTGNNSNMKEIQKEIDKLTTSIENGGLGWKSDLNSRLITADEVAKISGNEKFNSEITTWDKWFCLDTNEKDEINICEKERGTSLYWWLFDNTNDCTSSGCKTDDVSTYGYWTSTKVANSTNGAWNVRRSGTLTNIPVNDSANYGVRPVITISKDTL